MLITIKNEKTAEKILNTIPKLPEFEIGRLYGWAEALEQIQEEKKKGETHERTSEE